MERAVAWYAEHFGFETEVEYRLDDIGAQVVFLRNGEARIELFHFADSEDHDPDLFSLLKEGSGYHHIALKVADVPATVEALDRRGVEVVIPVTRGPLGIYAMVRDVDGNFVEIFPVTDMELPR
jgi:methylmalonyl-CoA/ethylmalonyl-CoA epimerase